MGKLGNMSNESENLEAMFNALNDDFHTTREEYQKGVLSYMGNKYSSLPGIMPHLPYRDGWIDLFGGSGAVTIARRKSKFEVFNDKHSGLISFFKCVQNEDILQELINTIELMPHSRELFVYNKSNWEADQNEVTRAAKFYYMIQSSFSGRGQAFGRDLNTRNTVWRKIHEKLPMFSMIHERFKNVLIENLDFRQCLKDFDGPGVIWYIDPPYVDSNVYQHGLGRKEHIELCERIFQLEGFVALSGYENDIYDNFSWDEVHQVIVDGRCATLAFDKNNNMQNLQGTVERKERIEYLWIKEAS